MRRTTAAANNIDTLVNTHANGDHWFGNSLVSRSRDHLLRERRGRDARATARSRIAQMMKSAPDMGETGAFLARIFGPFDFEGIEAALPNRTSQEYSIWRSAASGQPGRGWASTHRG